jgi:hypothetical protein
MRAIALLCSLLIACSLLGAPAEANWLTRLISSAEHAGSKAVRHGTGALDNMAGYIKALPHRPDSHALAAAATPEGHWRIVNKSGETFTAASPEELRRAFAVLAPEAAGAESRLALYLTEETVFRQQASLKDLPKGATLHVVIDKEAYRLIRKSEASGERLFAEVRPNLVVELSHRGLFDEAVFQLARPLKKANIRVIALQPGGPATFSVSPRLESATGRAVTDVIDPDRLRYAMSTIRGQTALVTGRLEGELIYFKPASGPERSLLIKDLTAAAEAADVNLIILKSSSARQPGTRNWLWLRAEVKGLSQALDRATLSDFLSALAGDGRMVVTATPRGPLRTTLDVRPARDLPGGSSSPISDAFADIVSDLAGRVVTSGVEASMVGGDRQRELDSRLLPGIPSQIQFGYLGLLILGLFGLPVARGWWQRLWPDERREEYGGTVGYWAAKLSRSGLLLLVFAPLIAIASAPAQALLGLWRAVLTVRYVIVLLWRGITWPIRKATGVERA